MISKNGLTCSSEGAVFPSCKGFLACSVQSCPVRMDRVSKEVRSKIMSRIRDRDTGPELALRRALSQAGIRGYRLYYKLPGKPDIAFTRRKVAVFIDGDFWHGYNWKSLGKVPPKAYWQEKISKTIARDKKNTRILKQEGWMVLRFWEHEVKEDINKVVRTIRQAIAKSDKNGRRG